MNCDKNFWAIGRFVVRFAVRLLRCFVLLCACALQFNRSWTLGVLFDACGRSLEVRNFLHSCKCVGRAKIFFKMLKWGSTLVWFSCLLLRGRWQTQASQRSLHNEPIFRLLLKVAVKGTQQCEFLNFCGVYSPITHSTSDRKVEILCWMAGMHVVEE